MRPIKKYIRCLLVGLGISAAVSMSAAATAGAAGPRWEVSSISNTNAEPGGSLVYGVQVTNGGDSPADGTVEPLQFTGTLPPGVRIDFSRSYQGAFSGVGAIPASYLGWDCSASHDELVSCTDSSEAIAAAPESGGLDYSTFIVFAEAEGVSGTQTAHFQVSGGGAPTAGTADPTTFTEASPPFGVDAFDQQALASDGSSFAQAGGHPDSFVTNVDFNTHTGPARGSVPSEGAENFAYPVEGAKDVYVDLPPGFIGNPTVAGRCSLALLAPEEGGPDCPPSSQVGTTIVRLNGFGARNALGPIAVYNMVSPVGVPARFGFNVAGNVITLDARLRSDGDYGFTVGPHDIPTGLPVAGSTLTFWGVPAASSHDDQRACSLPGSSAEPPYVGGPTCGSGIDPLPFLRMPTACGIGALQSTVHMDSWVHPGALLGASDPDLRDSAWKSQALLWHDLPGWPNSPSDATTPWGESQTTVDCANVPVKAALTARPTALETETSSGLAVHVEVQNPGLDNPNGIASSDIESVRVALPEGMTINPSQAEGLGVCSEAQYESSELSSHPDGGKGCRSDSKIGTVEVRTPLLEETIPGNVYIAKPYDNPFGSLLALYVVLEEPQRGVLIKLAGEVRTNETNGRIEASFGNLPELPFSSFDFKFREGARAPLVTPPTCGTYTTEAEITGWSDPEDPINSNSSFVITRGIDGSACPSKGIPSFDPGFSAGSINNNAGSYSPFYMRLARQDGEQELTRFSSVLPKGVLAKLAGVAQCPQGAVETAKNRSGSDELANPSCPASSRIGQTKAGAGVGSVLTYVPGSLYLGGPYHGAPLSVVSITPAVAGPFDVGTVVIQEGLDLDRTTAEAHVDGGGASPIPHILKGIPLRLRDLRIYVDRPGFTTTPTSCNPFAVQGSIFGSGADLVGSGDDVPVQRSARYQAANCASLGFKPRLSLRLKGGTRRSRHPALTAVLRAPEGQANIGRASVALPHSEFLAQSHIRTICTRVQFAADTCPAGSIYGTATATSPLVDYPLSGPVYLRSSDNPLPDMVVALRGPDYQPLEVDLVGRIDSKNGGVRATFEGVPDAPVSKFVLRMPGGQKSLLENSTDICHGEHRATVQMDGQNGKVNDFRPLLKAQCGKKSKPHKRSGR